MAGHLIEMVRDRLSRSLDLLRDKPRAVREGPRSPDPSGTVWGTVGATGFTNPIHLPAPQLSALGARGAEAIKRYFPQSYPGLPRPRVHGNGFVQLDLDREGSRRLHIWGHPEIPRQAVRSGIHDHTYWVNSEILVGQIVDVTWEIMATFDPDRRTPFPESSFDHAVYTAVPRTGADTELVSTGARVVIADVGVKLIGSRTSCYSIPPGVFHSTITDGPAATLMEKRSPSTPGGSGPRVLLPVGQKPDNEFDRNAYDPLMLYGIIDEVYPRWHELITRT